jgi:hypothetical protein
MESLLKALVLISPQRVISFTLYVTWKNNPKLEKGVIMCIKWYFPAIYKIKVF